MRTSKLLSRFVSTGRRLVVFVALLAALLGSVKPASAATVPFDLYAVSGTTTLGTQVVNVWGYNLNGAAATQPGGPTLIVNQGDLVQITLHNQLPEATALLFQGQDMVPDTTGAPAAGTRLYSFTAGRPGTYLYEAGLLPNAQHQTAMGLAGALIVRSATVGQAYNDPATAYTDEAVLLLSEIDPALSNSATPATFDMRKFAPRYFLINGLAYPNTAAIPTIGGNNVLLRYVNAGIQYHSMAVLGAHQTFIALDGSKLDFSRRFVAETIGPGQTADAIVTAPAATGALNRLAVYDGNLLLHSTNTAGFGGMLTFLTVAAGTAGTDITGPATSNVAYAAGNLTATVSDATTGGNNVTAAEYFLDTTGAPGAGTSMSGGFGSVSVNVTAAVTVPSGQHTLYVRGRDSLGNWGFFSSVLVNGGDATGPATTSLALAPNPTNGTAAVALTGTGNDSAAGGSNIAAAEYFIDPAGTPANGTGIVMTVNVAAPVAGLSATIPAATVNGLASGSHTVAVRSRDAVGNWGALASITLTVDKVGPTTSAVSAAPSPNNGTLPFNPSTPAVRVTATIVDPLSGGINSNLVAAEGFICTTPATGCAVGANGTGFVFAAGDGTFNSTSEIANGDIPLPTILQLSNGSHTIYVHGKDAAGNWGATTSTTILIDKLAPTFTGISLAPNPPFGAANVTLTVLGAADTGGAGVAGGEYWINPPTTTTPAPGTGTQFNGLTASIPVGTLANGSYTVSARIRDAAGNWSTGTNGTRSATLIIAPINIFSNNFDTGGAPWGWTSRSTTTAARLNVSALAAQAGARGLQAQGNNTNYVQYTFGTAAQPATPTYDARFYFNPNNNASTGQDIFAAATSGGFGTQLFHVRYRRNLTQPQVQIQVGATANGTWTNINNNAHNRIEVVWQSGSTLQLYVNGVLSQTLTAGTGSVSAVRLGSVTSSGSATLMYFDTFASKRTVSPLVGP